MIIVIGCISGGFSSIAIMLPNGLTSGGITGISRIIMNYCDISFSVLYYVAALTVLILCLFVLGKRGGKYCALDDFISEYNVCDRGIFPISYCSRRRI